MPVKRSISLRLTKTSPKVVNRLPVHKEAPARLQVTVEELDAALDADAAFDASQYFSDDVRDPWREGGRSNSFRVATERCRRVGCYGRCGFGVHCHGCGVFTPV